MIKPVKCVLYIPNGENVFHLKYALGRMYPKFWLACNAQLDTFAVSLICEYSS